LEIQEALQIKVSRYRQPFQQLKLQYGTSKGRAFTEEEDRFLLCTLHQIGYDKETAYEELRRQVRQAPAFRFDWFLKSRTATELQRRCNTLISLVEKEMEDAAEKDAGGPSAKAPGGGQKRKAESAAAAPAKKAK
jgi:hypothetical protein